MGHKQRGTQEISSPNGNTFDIENKNLPAGSKVGGEEILDKTDAASKYARKDTAETMTQVTMTGNFYLDGDAATQAKIAKNNTTLRDELQIYAAGDSFSTNSKGAGIHLYGNYDDQHAGNIAFLTGQDDQGDARMIISGGSSLPASGGYRTNTDTRVTIGNDIWNFVDGGNDTALLTLKNPIDRPALLIKDAGSTEGDIAVDDGDFLSVGHWSGTVFTERLRMNTSGDLVPATDGGVNCGSTTRRWQNIGTKTLDIINPDSRPAIFIDNTFAIEGDMAVPNGERLDIGWWDAGTTTFTTKLAVDGVGRPLLGDGAGGITTNSTTVAKAKDSGSRAMDLYVPTTTGGADVLRSYSDVGGVKTNTATIEANGNFLSATNSYGALSDENFKTEIVKANSQWDDIKNVELMNYKMKADVAQDPDNAIVHLGVIAQQLEAAGMGGLVEDKLPEYDDDGVLVEEGYKAVKTSVLLLKALGALQEAMSRIEELETKVN